MATCPECDAEIEVDEDDLDDMEVGDPWDCDSCGSHLRVASLDPLEFDGDEDEDDDEEDDDEEADDETVEGDEEADEDVDDEEEVDGEWEE